MGSVYGSEKNGNAIQKRIHRTDESAKPKDGSGRQGIETYQKAIGAKRT